VLGIRRPHMGVDFGAPRGAPVVAIADATVAGAAFTSGGGNTVVLRHAGGYESRYLHLSRYAPGMRAGARVQQGQVIGYVGATGLVTGAHLHYELKKNGGHVNPIAEQRKHPPGEPIPAALRDAFLAARDTLRTRFVSDLPPDSVDVEAATPTP
jgi:murein DD-endopeptidase MepM/ murein hydrolase activator NlpD